MLQFERSNPVPRRLHGTVFATIHGVEGRLKDRHGLLSCCMCGKKCMDKVKRMLCGSEGADSRVYVKIDLDNVKVAETKTIAKSPSNLKWNQLFRIYCAHSIKDVIFTIKEDNPIGGSDIGRAKLPVGDIIKGFIAERWLDIVDEEGQPFPGGPKLHVALQFASAQRDSDSAQEVINPKSRTGVPYAYFNQREGCRVILYQDAHVPDRFKPTTLQGAGQYKPHGHCWEDIFDAISEAKHFVYITGWSMYTEITLVRDSRRPGSNVTLGELLKRKADEGVTVLLLLWDFSKFLQGVKLDRQMGIHDLQTYEYFKSTKVRCVLCPRRPPDDEKQRGTGLEISTLFTHHQKSVIVDWEVPDEASQKRRIVCFIGGLDLCDGRYDTPDHPLFKTLDTVHYNDFHQPNFPGASIKKGGPREPWHDVHCRLEGPVAWDVLYNFEQRWRKVVGSDFLVPHAELNEVIVHPLTALPSIGNETWNVRLFRSIDVAEAYGFPDKPENAAALGLTSMRDHIFERSIQDAYINAIRRAQHFIYIENQYFCGSSFAWRSDGTTLGPVDALNLVPRELSLKIVSKIEAGKRFVVYVVIPMWPEGVPESDTVQEILDWQRRTMEMMYTDIEEALRRKELKTDPREYLTFFCLGNRETKKDGEYAPPENPEPSSDYARAQHARRFMIYVHSKLMIVDDEYIIIGSANLNQRSMDGTRDTEIAMGAYQPHYLATKEPARGQIHGFRMALWYEHLGMLHESFESPQEEVCVRLVNEIADYNWKAYASDYFAEALQGQLLRYPIAIGAHGAVTALKGAEHFPDTNALVLGKNVHIVPPIATT